MAHVAAEAFHVAEYIEEAMKARGWDVMELALRMGGATAREVGMDKLMVDLLLSVREPGLLLGDEMPAKLARAFGTSPEMWANLDRAWRNHPSVKAE